MFSVYRRSIHVLPTPGHVFNGALVRIRVLIFEKPSVHSIFPCLDIKRAYITQIKQFTWVTDNDDFKSIFSSFLQKECKNVEICRITFWYTFLTYRRFFRWHIGRGLVPHLCDKFNTLWQGIQALQCARNSGVASTINKNATDTCSSVFYSWVQNAFCVCQGKQLLTGCITLSKYFHIT